MLTENLIATDERRKFLNATATERPVENYTRQTRRNEEGSTESELERRRWAQNA